MFVLSVLEEWWCKLANGFRWRSRCVILIVLCALGGEGNCWGRWKGKGGEMEAQESFAMIMDGL